MGRVTAFGLLLYETIRTPHGMRITLVRPRISSSHSANAFSHLSSAAGFSETTVASPKTPLTCNGRPPTPANAGVRDEFQLNPFRPAAAQLRPRQHRRLPRLQNENDS